MVVFLLWQVPVCRAVLTDHFLTGADPLRDGRVWTLISAAFSHEALQHLAVNMVLLYIFGRDLEVIYGGRNLTALYLVGAIAAFLSQAAFHATLGAPGTLVGGASGGIMAIAVATVLFYPGRRLDFFGIFTVPLWLLVLLFIALDLSGFLQATQGVTSGAAHGAHLGGALAGAVFKVLDLRLFSPHSAESAALGPSFLFRVRRRLGHVPRDIPLDDRVVDMPLLNSHDAMPTLAARVDDILRKISREGLDSLSEEERSVLETASEEYRSRTL